MKIKKWILRLSILAACLFLWIGLVGCKGIDPLPGGKTTQLRIPTTAVSVLPGQILLGTALLSPTQAQNPISDEGIIPDTGRVINNRVLTSLAIVAVIGVALVLLGLMSKG